MPLWLPAEPTKAEINCFLDLLEKIPCKYTGAIQDPSHPDYGDQYTCYINVVRWLSKKSDRHRTRARAPDTASR